MNTLDSEALDRMDLHDKMIDLCVDWKAFAQYYHSYTFTDDVHLFGALVREYHEMLEEAKRVRSLIKRFENECIATHNYDGAREILLELADVSISLAEESAQIGAVAKKGNGSIPNW